MRKIILILVFFLPFGIIRSQIKSLDDIQGDWTCVNMSRYMGNLATDIAYPNDLDWITPTRNMQIKNNQLWLFDYPCEYFYTIPLKSDSGNFYYSRNEPPYYNTYNFILRNDTLIVEEFPGTLTGYYVKDTFDQNIITKLKKDSINQSCLQATWDLTVEYNSGYDGLGILPVICPFKVPIELKISTANLYKYYLYGRIIQLDVNGTLRKFRIERLSNKENVLKLNPKFWFKRLKQKDMTVYSEDPEYLMRYE